MSVTNPRVERTFTTFEVARICGVFHTTVINWANIGKLRTRYTPGGHRRIPLSSLLEFMRRYDIPIPKGIEERRKQVLIVEDDPDVQRMLTRALQPLREADIRACVSGLEALIAIGRDQPDLLLLDIRIPQVSGLEVCRVLRANEQMRPIRIIALSGQILTEDEQSFLASHTDAFFRKPLPTAELRAKAQELLELDVHSPG